MKNLNQLSLKQKLQCTGAMKRDLYQKTQLQQNALLPRPRKALSKLSPVQLRKEKCLETVQPEEPAITSKIVKEEKPHETMELTLKMGSIPRTLIVKAKNPEFKVVKYKRNPGKFSFGKVVFNSGKLEFFCYPQKKLHSVFLSCSKTSSAEGDCFICDIRKLAEIHNLLKKVQYFLSLTHERKRKYLQKHGFSANINITKTILPLKANKIEEEKVNEGRT